MGDMYAEILKNVDRIEKIVLEHKTDGHMKYYHMSRLNDVDFSFRAAWGRIGNRPQTKDYPLPALGLGANFMMDTLRKKLAKGYEIMSFKLIGSHSPQYEEFRKLLGEDECELLD